MIPEKMPSKIQEALDKMFELFMTFDDEQLDVIGSICISIFKVDEKYDA